MDTYIQKFISARQTFIDTIDTFPIDKRESILFDKWSLKQILIHMVFWDTCIAENIAFLKKGQEPPFYGKVNDFNQLSIEKGKNWDWKKTYHEFINAGKRLIGEYETLPEEKWDQKFWKTKNSTPKKLLHIVTKHYSHEHLPEIIKVAKTL